MISYIVASNDPEVLDANLTATLKLQDDDELVVIEDPPSIAVAYNQGQAKAANPIRCYVHSDVQILDPARLRESLIRTCVPRVGMVGMIGSFDRVLPWWWCRQPKGSVIDARSGLLDYDPGGYCIYVDGLLLASAHDLTWDESYTGFHMYDHDMCEQMLARGLPNYALTGGGSMVLHNTRNPSDVSQLNGWDTALARFRNKWGTS